jgi:hypothetical protein
MEFEERKEDRKSYTHFTLSNNRLHPAARIGSPGFKPTARTATMISSGPVITGSGTSRNSSFEGDPKADTPIARIICLAGFARGFDKIWQD